MSRGKSEAGKGQKHSQPEEGLFRKEVLDAGSLKGHLVDFLSYHSEESFTIDELFSTFIEQHEILFEQETTSRTMTLCNLTKKALIKALNFANYGGHLKIVSTQNDNVAYAIRT